METQGIITLGAGMVKTVEDIRRTLDLPVDEITVGSLTIPQKDGNAEPNFYTDGTGNYWNAIGLKNGGIEYYKKVLPEMSALVRSAGRLFVVSISGNTPEENRILAQEATNTADVVELNIACPNIVTGDGGRKPLIGYSAAALKAHFEALVDVGEKKRQHLRIKVPPYLDMDQLSEIANVVRFYQHCGWFIIKSLVATNTMPNCFPLKEDGKQAISVGYAGGSGRQLHTLAVGNVKKWLELLPSDIEVIGAGGVSEATQVKNFERVGALRSQMAGAYWEGGPKAFQHVLLGL